MVSSIFEGLKDRLITTDNFVINNDTNRFINYIDFEILAVKANNTAWLPFLSYLMIENCINNHTELTFLKLRIENDKFNNILNIVKQYISDILRINDENTIASIKYHGIFIFKKKYFICIDITNISTWYHDLNLKNRLYHVSIDEILNCRKVFDINISPYVNELFISNLSLCYLTNSNDESFEIPSVYYYYSKQSDWKTHVLFYLMPSIGKYTYLLDFETLNQELKMLNMKDNKYIGLRYVVFIGQSNYLKLKNDTLKTPCEYVDGLMSTKEGDKYVNNISDSSIVNLGNSTIILVKNIDQIVSIEN